MRHHSIFQLAPLLEGDKEAQDLLQFSWLESVLTHHPDGINEEGQTDLFAVIKCVMALYESIAIKRDPEMLKGCRHATAKRLLNAHEAVHFGPVGKRSELLGDQHGKTVFTSMSKEGASGGNVERSAMEGLVHALLLRGAGKDRRERRGEATALRNGKGWGGQGTLRYCHNLFSKAWKHNQKAPSESAVEAYRHHVQMQYLAELGPALVAALTSAGLSNIPWQLHSRTVDEVYLGFQVMLPENSSSPSRVFCTYHKEVGVSNLVHCGSNRRRAKNGALAFVRGLPGRTGSVLVRIMVVFFYFTFTFNV